MKNSLIILSGVLIAAMVTMIAPVQAGESVGRPAARLEEARFDAGTVVDGAVIAHSFAIENRGVNPLVIEKIQASCSCSTSSFEREIAPGKTGRIAVQVNTTGFGGHVIDKTFDVLTNDPRNRRIRLHVLAIVDRVVSVTPKIAKLEGRAGEDIQGVVSIRPEEKYPFHITGGKAAKGKDIRFRVEEVGGNGTPEYRLVVSATRKAPGRFFDKIELTTDSPVKPVLRIGIYGRIVPADNG